MYQVSLIKSLFILAVLVLLGVPAFAELNDLESGYSAGSPNMAAGLGVAAVPDYEGSDSYTAAPLLLFQSRYQNGQFVDLLGNRIKVNLMPSRNYQLGPVLQYRSKRDSHVDDSQVKRMEEVDAALEAGLFTGISVDNWLASLQVIKDVSDTHDGTLVSLMCDYRINMDNELMLVPYLSATWASSDYMETYFSVNSSNRGTSTLPDFDAESGFKDLTLAMIADYHPWEYWKFVGGAGYKQLLEDAEDSPLVDDRGESAQMFVGLVLAYQWGGYR